MSNNLKTIRLNLCKLFKKYRKSHDLNNKNYNYVYMLYCVEFHYHELTLSNRAVFKTITNPAEFWENMPAMESIARCKRKLAKEFEFFRPDKKEVIESRLKQTKEILESVSD